MVEETAYRGVFFWKETSRCPDDERGLDNLSPEPTSRPLSKILSLFNVANECLRRALYFLFLIQSEELTFPCRELIEIKKDFFLMVGIRIQHFQQGSLRGLSLS